MQPSAFALEMSTVQVPAVAPPPEHVKVHREPLVNRRTGAFPAELAPIDPPSDPAFWYCRIDSYTVDPEGESPWHYELRLRIRKADSGVDLATLGCPRTP